MVLWGKKSKNEGCEIMSRQCRRKSLVWIGIRAFLACIILVVALTVANYLPVGLADLRMSHAMGVNGTLLIPLGKTPVKAVQKVRHFPTLQIIHQEPVEGGVLLFIKRFYQKEGNEIQIEYVRKTWLGWKWVWGGGYAIGGSTPSQAVLDYMIMPKIDGIKTPFPMVFGEVLDPSIKNVIIIMDGQNPGVYTAKLTGSEIGQKIWFTFLPEFVSPPFEIEALNAKGDIMARGTNSDPHGFGELKIENP